MPDAQREQMTIVIVGHVDHGKSTVIGRLLADTGSLPEGKLEQVKALCAKTSRPFEYAFLLDALKDEQSQGITIDAARCFFKTARRNYLVFDAPGHIEFLKNMVTGAAHAEAALLVIDAHEGIRENSRRHGYLLSMLGVKQVAVVVNKMDLAQYDRKVFDAIREEYGAFLRSLNVVPAAFIPIAALHGENISNVSTAMPWYTGKTVLGQLDTFENRRLLSDQPLRFPVQDIYKFTADKDDRRIAAGTMDSGTVRAGEEVIFLPSFKRSKIQSVERFNVPAAPIAESGEAVGFTFTTQIYVRPGEIMVRPSDPQPRVSRRFRANVFWMGRAPFMRNKTYKIKIAAAHAQATLAGITQVLDAAELSRTESKQEVERHDVAEVVIETTRPVAFDLIQDNEGTGRFVIIDDYEIAGGGIILSAEDDARSLEHESVQDREARWYHSDVSAAERAERYGHRAKTVLICGPARTGKRAIAGELERQLFVTGCRVYYLGISNMVRGLDADIRLGDSDEQIRRVGELARIMTGAGLIFITTVSDLDDYDIERIKLLNQPAEIVIIAVGQSGLERTRPDLVFVAGADVTTSVDQICALLRNRDIVPGDYVI